MEFLIFIVLTLFVCLLVPVIISIRKPLISIKAIKRIAIINGVISFIIFSVIGFVTGSGVASPAPCLLWGSIGYYIMKRNCAVKEINNISPTENDLKFQNEQIDALTEEEYAHIEKTPFETGKNLKSQDKNQQEENTLPLSPVLTQETPDLTQPPPVGTANRFCQYCGQPIDKLSKRCMGCGRKYIFMR